MFSVDALFSVLLIVALLFMVFFGVPALSELIFWTYAEYDGVGVIILGLLALFILCAAAVALIPQGFVINWR